MNYDVDEAKIEWFLGAKLNITENCIDRHLKDEEAQKQLSYETITLMKKVFQ